MDVALLLAARLEVEPFSADAGAEPDAPAAAPRGTSEAVDAVARAQRARQPERVWPLLRELEPQLPRLLDDDPASAGRVLGVLATQSLIEGDPEAFLVRSRSAVEAFDRAGERAAALAESVSLGAGCRMLGVWDEAEAALRGAIHSPGPVAARARFDLARVLSARRPGELVDELMGVAISRFHQRGERIWEGAARAWLCASAVKTGTSAGSLALAREAGELLAESPGGRVYAATAMAAALLAEGEVQAALAAAEQAHRELARLGRIDEGEVELLLTLGEVRRAAGDEAGAAAALAEARRCVLADASKLRDPARRRGFLEGIPQHRRALAPAG